MTWWMGLFTYVNVWWLMLFFVLPFGIEKADAPESVHYIGSPKKLNLGKKLLINSLLSVAVTCMLALFINSGLVSVHDMT
jgi:predicted secreted protein